MGLWLAEERSEDENTPQTWISQRRKHGLERVGVTHSKTWVWVEDLDCGGTERGRKNTETVVNEERKLGLKRMCNTHPKFGLGLRIVEERTRTKASRKHGIVNDGSLDYKG